MRRSGLIVAVFFLSFLGDLLLSGSVIREFRAEPSVNKVQLLWKVTVESGVRGYKIQRGFDSTQLADLDFVQATTDAIPPEGKTYTYTDQSIFKYYSGRTFYYRIQVIDTQGKVITSTNIQPVSPQISAVRHTWGSIKAIFR